MTTDTANARHIINGIISLKMNIASIEATHNTQIKVIKM
jgi:hypothetical protein